MTRSSPARTHARVRLALLAALAAAGCGRHPRVAAATASEVTVTPGVLVPPFSPTTNEYTVALPYGVADVTVFARVGAPGSALTVNDLAVASGQPSAAIPLVPGRTDVRVAVSGPAAQSTRTYRIAVERAPGLQDLAHSTGTFTPPFTPDVLEYDVALAAPELVLTPFVAEGGVAIAVDGRAAATGAPVPLDMALGERSVPVTLTSADGLVQRTYVLRVHRSAPTLAHEVYAKASNTDRLDAFGSVVATDGIRVVVGAPLEDSNRDPRGNAHADAGAVYVLEPGLAGWTQTAMVKATNAEASDRFGTAVAIDGDTLVVGAPHESSDARGVDGDKSNNGSPSSGAVYVFVRGVSGWGIQAYLKASNTGDNDRFGSVVAISGDRIAVGAPGEDSGARGVGGAQHDDSVSDAGAVYVFCRVGDQWSQEAYLKATNSGGFDAFGSALALHGDTLVVGAPAEDSAATGVGGIESDDGADQSGAAYVFVSRNGTWHAEAYLKASNTGAEDLFGSAVAVHGDLVAVGAPGEASAGAADDDSAPSAGAVYTFRRSGDVWLPQRYVKAAHAQAGDAFGAALAFDGTTLLVGAPGEDAAVVGVDGMGPPYGAEASGCAYVFVRDGDAWFQRHYLKATNTGAGDAFGTAVAVARTLAVVGAPREDSAAAGVGGDQGSEGAPDAGAAYVLGVR